MAKANSKRSTSSTPKGSTVLDFMLSKAVQKELGELEKELGTAQAETNSARHLCGEIIGNPGEPEYRVHGAEALLLSVERRMNVITRRIHAMRKPATVQL